MLKIHRNTSEIVDLRYREALEIIKKFRSAVNDRRLLLVTAGTDIEVSGYGVVALQGRSEDMVMLQGLAFGAQLRLAGGDFKTLMDFLDRENVLHRLTPTQMIDLWRQGAAFVSGVYARSWQVKEMDPTTTDPSAWE